MDGMESWPRSLNAIGDEAVQLRVALDVALDVVRGCEQASVTLLEKRRQQARFATPVATDPRAERADALQYDLDEGPCLQAVRQHQVVLCPELVTESRWPQWAPAVARELGFKSILSLPLYTDSKPFGSLNLYSGHAQAYNSVELTSARAVARLIAFGLVAGRRVNQLNRALENRLVIGQAEGILMERCDLDVDQAFAYLSRVSQQRNLKLVVVAAELVETRVLPDRGGDEHVSAVWPRRIDRPMYARAEDAPSTSTRG